MPPVRPHDPAPSPCINVCKLDESRRYCTGCLRTREEIGRWSLADTAEKLAILARVKTRAEALKRR